MPTQVRSGTIITQTDPRLLPQDGDGRRGHGAPRLHHPPREAVGVFSFFFIPFGFRFSFVFSSPWLSSLFFIPFLRLGLASPFLGSPVLGLFIIWGLLLISPPSASYSRPIFPSPFYLGVFSPFILLFLPFLPPPTSGSFPVGRHLADLHLNSFSLSAFLLHFSFSIFSFCIFEHSLDLISAFKYFPSLPFLLSFSLNEY